MDAVAAMMKRGKCVKSPGQNCENNQSWEWETKWELIGGLLHYGSNRLNEFRRTIEASSHSVMGMR